MLTPASSSSGVDAKVRRGLNQEVGFAIKSELIGKFSGLSKGIIDRLIALKGMAHSFSHIFTAFQEYQF